MAEDRGASRFGQSDTQIFIDLALERGYVTRAQVEECQDIRRKVQELGLDQSISDILVKKGYLAEADAQRVERALSGRRRLGNFEIVARIGQGSMGAVFKARQISMDRYVAVKILPPRMAADRTYIERFMCEARAVAKLNHVNIVQGIDVGEADGYYYFAMEYVEGVTVRETLKTKGPYNEKAALDIVVQMARALDHAARAGLVHRDIKPDNIIVTPAGVAKLLDLGIAKTLGADGEEGVRVGTPYYISPEQARGDADVDARSDIYSLGATFYHMVVGSPPFSGSSSEEIIRAHLTATVPNPREVRPGLSRNLSRVIEMMMARQPADRYQSASELLSDLDKIAHGLPPARARTFQGASSVAGSQDTANTSMTSPLQPVSAAGRQSRTILAAAAVAGLAIVVGGLLALKALSGPPPAPPVLPPPPQVPVPVPVPTPTPNPEPGTDPKSAAAEEMLNYALGEIAKNPGNIEGHMALIEQVVADTRGTAANIKAQKKLEELKSALEDSIRKSWEAAWSAAEAKARERRYAEALLALDASFPTRYRTKYAAWGDRYRAGAKSLGDGAEAWLVAQEKLSADLCARHEFDKARAAVQAMAMAGTAGLAGRMAANMELIAKAEEDHRRLLADQKQKQEEEARRQKTLAYGNFLKELYSQHAPKGFADAEEFCRGALKDPARANIRAEMEVEAGDLDAMKRAAADLFAALAALKGPVRIRYRGQLFTCRVKGPDKDNAEKLWFASADGPEFPVTLQGSDLVPAEVVELTAFGRGAPGAALRAGLYLTWRGDYSGARSCLQAAEEGEPRTRALARADFLEKGLGELLAADLVQKARAAGAARNADGFARIMAELRAKHAGSAAYAAARDELERLEMEAAMAALDPALLALGAVKADPGGLSFAYDFRFDSPQVLDWQSSGDMWRWKQAIFDRNGIDLFLSESGQLVLRAPADGQLTATWAVPLDGFASLDCDVVLGAGRRSFGVGLGRPGGGEDMARAWFSQTGQLSLRQGKAVRQAAGKLDLQAGLKYHLRLELAGGEFRVLLDGKELVRDKATFNPANSRLFLGGWSSELSFDNVRIVARPEAGWLKRRAELAARFRAAGVQPGLAGEYFADAAMTKSVGKRIEPAPYFWWFMRPPVPEAPKDGFGARFAGKLFVEKEGKYRLHLRSDDLGKLFLDGRKLIEGNPFYGTAEANLAAGFHDLVLEVEDVNGQSGLELSWEPPGLPRQVVPVELLGH